MNRLTISLLLACATLARAESPKADLGTPKAALKYFDSLGADASIDRAGIIYHAVTPDEKKVAKAFAAVDLALAKLRAAAVARFDRDAGDRMVHALRDITADDVEAAKVTVNGDKATLTGKGISEPLPMVQVEGAWKISMKEAIEQSRVTAEDLAVSCQMLVDATESTRKELAADKFANPSLLERGDQASGEDDRRSGVSAIDRVPQSVVVSASGKASVFRKGMRLRFFPHVPDVGVAHRIDDLPEQTRRPLRRRVALARRPIRSPGHPMAGLPRGRWKKAPPPRNAIPPTRRARIGG